MIAALEPPERPLLFLWGFMGTGKSTVGLALATLSGARFVDLDAQIAAAAGRSIAEMFASDGEAGFRELERAAVLAEIRAPPEPRVVALGGGALLDPAVRAHALTGAYVVVLTASAPIIAARTAGGERPLLKHNPELAIDQLLADRADAYSAAHLTIVTDDLDVAGVTHRLAGLWKTRILPLARDPDTLP